MRAEQGLLPVDLARRAQAVETVLRFFRFALPRREIPIVDDDVTDARGAEHADDGGIVVEVVQGRSGLLEQPEQRRFPSAVRADERVTGL